MSKSEAMTTEQDFYAPNIRLIHPEIVAGRWQDDYAEFVQQALDKASGTFEDIEALYDMVQMDQAWVLEICTGQDLVALAIVELSDCPDGQVLHVHTLGGEGMDFWLEIFIEYLQEMAKGLNCIGVTCTGRMGWQRVLKKHGFIPQYVNMRLGGLG